MPNQAEMIGWLIIIVWLLAAVGLIHLIDAANKKFRGLMARRSARRILLHADHSEILAARCRVMDARKDRME